MNKKLTKLCKNINAKIEKLDNELKKIYNGRKAVIPTGKHAGRIGVIKSIHYYDGRIICLIPPINKKNKDKLIWDNEARNFFNFTEIDKTTIK